MLSLLPNFLAGAALAGMVLVHAEDAPRQSAPRAVCRLPECPREAARRGDEGIVVLGLLVREDGTVERSAVFGSSGKVELDLAALHSLSTCRFRPRVKDGKAIASWMPVTYVWMLDDDPKMLRAKQAAAAVAAKNDDADAYYHLGRLLFKDAATDADRERALALLLAAAERGQSHAKFELGWRYELGYGVEADAAEALQW